MDEPFAALDPQNRLKMQQYLLEIWQNIDITIFFITHDLDEAIYLADRILVLDANPGRVREVVNVPLQRPRADDTLLSPAFMATKEYLESLVHPPNPSWTLRKNSAWSASFPLTQKFRMYFK